MQRRHWGRTKPNRQGHCGHRLNNIERAMPGGGGGYSHTLPIRVFAAQGGCDFEAPDLERAIHFTGVF